MKVHSPASLYCITSSLIVSTEITHEFYNIVGQQSWFFSQMYLIFFLCPPDHMQILGHIRTLIIFLPGCLGMILSVCPFHDIIFGGIVHHF